MDPCGIPDSMFDHPLKERPLSMANGEHVILTN